MMREDMWCGKSRDIGETAGRDAVLSDLGDDVSTASVRISADADAALGQLTPWERKCVFDLLRVLEEAGLPAGGNGIAQHLRGDDPLYLVRVPGAPDVRLIVRTGGANGLPLVVEDVVRPATLRNVFKVHDV
jgi:hypothetical protein